MKKLQKEVMTDMMALQSLPTVSKEELAKHNKKGDAWVLIDGIVYDVSKFAALHPGGEAILYRYAGTDVSRDFKQVHAMAILTKPAYARLRVGRVAVEEMDPKEAKKLMTTKVMEKWLPFSQPQWLDPRGTFKSPYFKPKHIAYQKKLSAWLDAEVRPFTHQWDEANKYPADLHERAYKAGFYSPRWPVEYGGTPPEGGWDYFMNYVHVLELSKTSGGIFASWFFTMSIALPPILHHGNKITKDRVVRDVVTGKKVIALAVTEPWGGSDVANVRTTARRDGDYYIVSGEKKFITSGMTAHYFTTCVRTDPSKKGMAGLSVLCIDGDLPGLERRKIKTQGWWAGNTALITFDNVRVHKDNLVGVEGEGFRYIMENFNHERFEGLVGSVAAMQGLIGESIKYARNRETFGKPLIENQVIRQKLAQMAMRMEAYSAWVENIAFQLENKVPHQDIAATIALAKVQGTQMMEFCAREASQIFGGFSYQRGGVGERVERIYREVRVSAIGGGSEEILQDFAMRASKI